jgi:ribosomal protein S6--L-glutamate ligase
VRKFVAAAEAQPFHPVVLDPYQVAISAGEVCGKGGKDVDAEGGGEAGESGIRSCVYHASEPFHADVVINRLSSLACEYSVQVLAGFERSGALTINPARPTSEYRHKFSALAALESAGLPVPQTRLIRSGQDINRAVVELGGPPVVLKFARGTQGLGVIWAESFDAVSSIAESLNLIQYDVMIQRYYAGARDLDLRVLVLGGEPIAAVRRMAGEDGFRSNFHRGGSLHRFKLTGELAELAIRASNAIGLNFAGVDIIMGEDGPLVLEVNLSPGFEGLDNAYNSDIARQVVKWAGERLE